MHVDKNTQMYINTVQRVQKELYVCVLLHACVCVCVCVFYVLSPISAFIRQTLTASAHRVDVMRCPLEDNLLSLEECVRQLPYYCFSLPSGSCCFTHAQPHGNRSSQTVWKHTCMHTHRHTHTHTHTHKRTQRHTHTHTNARTQRHIHAQTDTKVGTNTHIECQRDALTHANTLTHTHIMSYDMYAHAHTHTQTHIHTHTHTHTHIHSWSSVLR